MQEIILTITVKTDGTVSVTGPIDNKLLCYGLLHHAMDVVREFKTAGILATPPGLHLSKAAEG